MRGALLTVDRDYGMLNLVFHHITDNHVTHHLFSIIPHYRAGEATRAIKPILGNYYTAMTLRLFVMPYGGSLENVCM